MEENENSSFASLPEEEKKKKSKVGRIILWILLGMLIALINYLVSRRKAGAK